MIPMVEGIPLDQVITPKMLRKAYRDQYEIVVKGDDRDGHWFMVVEKDTRIIRGSNYFYASANAAHVAAAQSLNAIVKKHMDGVPL